MKKLLIYIITGVLITTQYACNKQLSALPENEKVEGSAIFDARTAQIALNGAYQRLAGARPFTDWANHQVWPGMLTGYIGTTTGEANDEINDNQRSAYSITLWQDAYGILAAANVVIAATGELKNVPDEKKNVIIAEARFIRAYVHFRLLMYFGEWFKPDSKFGALLRTEPSKLSNVLKARSTVSESFQSILEDLEFAGNNGPATNPSHYATKYTALGLKMRVLMMRGQASDYTTAITTANTIISKSPYVLEDSTKDIFSSKGLSSKEVMMGIKPAAGQEVSYYNLSYSYYPGHSSLFVARPALNTLLQTDPRKSWLLGSQIGANANVHFFTKYIKEGTEPTQVSETSYLMRLTEVYLLQAEAIIRSGGDLQEARSILKKIMGHGGVTDFSAIDNATTSSELLLQNYYEIARNLVAEDGAEWLALMRLPFATVQQIKPTISSTVKFYFPVPTMEFEQNTLFGMQNPGYNF